MPLKPDIFWIAGPWPGRMAIAGRPRGNDWLGDEVKAWRTSGIDEVVSLLTADEEAELGLKEEERLCRQDGISFISHPIPDRSVPPDFAKGVQLIREMEGHLAKGRKIVVHCRQGIGRSATVAACLLVSAGLQPDAAFRRLREARGFPVPETEEQREWVKRFSRQVAPVQR